MQSTSYHRRRRYSLLILAAIALPGWPAIQSWILAASAPPARPWRTAPGTPLLITSPPNDDFRMWINEDFPCTATTTDAAKQDQDGDAWYAYSDVQSLAATRINFHVGWTAPIGSFTNAYGPSTTYLAPDYSPGNNLRTVTFTATADGAVPSREPSAASHVAGLAVMAAASTTAGSASRPDFESELKAAKQTADRDEKIDHLRKALALRPDDPRNISLEFQVGVLLSQTSDPIARRPVHPMEGLAVFEDIVHRYDHMHYYRSEPADTPRDPQLLVPAAAIQAASILLARSNDPVAARQYIDVAMKDLQWTCHRRERDWKTAAKPRPSPFVNGMHFSAHVRIWEQRQHRAADGDVLGASAQTWVNAAVRVYGYTFGPQHPNEAARTMQRIIDRYPATPIAKAARQQMDRAKQSLGASRPAD